MENDIMDELSLSAMSWKDQVIYLANHGAEDSFIRAFIRTKPETDWSQLRGEDTPQFAINQGNDL